MQNNEGAEASNAEPRDPRAGLAIHGHSLRNLGNSKAVSHIRRGSCGKLLHRWGEARDSWTRSKLDATWLNPGRGEWRPNRRAGRPVSALSVNHLQTIAMPEVFHTPAENWAVAPSR